MSKMEIIAGRGCIGAGAKRRKSDLWPRRGDKREGAANIRPPPTDITSTPSPPPAQADSRRGGGVVRIAYCGADGAEPGSFVRTATAPARADTGPAYGATDGIEAAAAAAMPAMPDHVDGSRSRANNHFMMLSLGLPTESAVSARPPIEAGGCGHGTSA